MKTKREIRQSFRDMYDLLIPSGTSVRWIEGGQGGYVVAPSACKLLSKTDSLFKHDSTYFYIWVDSADVEGN